MRVLALALPGCPAVAAAAPADAGARMLILSPADMRAETHSRSLVMSFTSTYQRLSGFLRFDPRTGSCHIDVRFEVASLTAPNAVMHAEAMSTGFLDPRDFPETRYVGDCAGNELIGSLTLRGQTHPFDMALSFSGALSSPVAVHAEGTLDRYVWGVNGLRPLVGRNIRITNDIALAGAPAG